MHDQCAVTAGYNKVFSVHLKITNHEHLRTLRNAGVEDAEEKASTYLTQNVEAVSISQAIEMVTTVEQWKRINNRFRDTAEVLNVSQVIELHLTRGRFMEMQKAREEQEARMREKTVGDGNTLTRPEQPQQEKKA